MAKKRSYRFFSCDFETTVYKNQVNTEVWASAVVELNTEDVKIFGSIAETFEYFKSLKTNIVCYYHNLKFDGHFWLSYLMVDLGMKQAIDHVGNGELSYVWKKTNKMKNNTFQYVISDIGQWYSIKIMINDFIIEIRDSLKLLPFSVKEIGKAFNTKHRKLEMEYTGFRYANCPITEKEKEYIANDVLVVKEALEIMFTQGHKKLTIGSCCLEEFKTIITKKSYEKLFPDLTLETIPGNIYGSKNADEYIRHSYKGGWCYLVKGKENKIYKNGTTADVNSLYPSVMSSESGSRYPIGKPTFWSGNRIPEEAKMRNRYYFIRIKTRFYIKDNMLPFIQIKGSLLYKGTECLESSDITNPLTKEKSAFFIGFNKEIKDTRVTLTLTCTDYELFLEHYNVIDFEILDGCYFDTTIGLFDEYIEKYKKIKMESKGAMRTLAKLFLNNLYGKMASSTDSTFKMAYVKPDKTIGFTSIPANEKKPGYIAVGSAITSYARNFTIRSAQKNYHGVDKPGFIYADTDSIHCDLQPDDIKGIKVHDTNFCCWKLEASWDIGLFVRQKTYVEHVVKEDLHVIPEPYYNIKCAGMPEKCKNLFELSMQGYAPKENDKFSEEELKFLETKRELKDFKQGLIIPGKLLPKRIRGGILLTETTYEMR